MTANRIIFWRHGQTDFNRERRIQGALDIPLNETGLSQARYVAPYIAAMSPVRIVSSPLSRAYHTAKEVAVLTGVHIETDEHLTERDFGVFEGKTREELLDMFPEEYAQWKNGLSPQSIGIETRMSVGKRASAAINDYASDMERGTLLVVSHGAALSCAMTCMLGMNPDEWFGVAGLDNCHWSLMRSLEQDPHWRLLAHNRVISTECESELGVQGIGSIES